MREVPLLAFAIGLAIMSIVSTGGPRAAAAERRDQVRLSDLTSLASRDACRRLEYNVCDHELRAHDPFTGLAYERRKDPDRWCARFERPERLIGQVRGGCVWS